jgi:sugar lactone lactonase YvrE
MTRLAVRLFLVAAVAGVSADAAPPTPVVRLAGLPETLVVGQRWVARLTVRPPARPILRATSGARRVSVQARSTGRVRYSATLRLPTPGIWRLSAFVRRRSFPLGRVRVIASYPLALPAQILASDDRSLLVVERQGRDRILRVDPATGRFSVVTTRIPSPWGLARDANGRVIVSGGSGIYELGGTKIADVAAGPIAAAANGDLYLAEQTRVGRIGRGGGVETLSTAVAAPHGLVLRRDGSLVVSDSGNGRLLRIDPATRETAVVASGLKSPLGAIEAADGHLLVVEYDSGRLLRIGDGRVVAQSLRKPYALTQSADGSIYVVESGDDGRPSGGIARVADDGSVVRLRLVPT